MKYILGVITNDEVSRVQLTEVDYDHVPTGNVSEEKSLDLENATLYCSPDHQLVLKLEDDSPVDNEGKKGKDDK